MPETKDRQVRVTYRRQVSDGNYGTESAEVTLDWWIDDTDDGHEDETAAEEMLRQAHDLVHNQLRRSISTHIRQSTTPRTTAPANTAATVPADDEAPF